DNYEMARPPHVNNRSTGIQTCSSHRGVATNVEELEGTQSPPPVHARRPPTFTTDRFQPESDARFAI
ncbi:MAG: hypothetical protein AAF456_25590, partial [Planctomycetota bacterium]